ncbi:Inner membrane protein YccS [Variovorax sp. SRS16]|uniref:FUSC family membrane protein n=1 Tax=Variovorax sp. SRS16 TaxID=282217 RepID=UPI001315DE79|nr:FUSC family membrane protein [Variovorax sp. SRS16]VTU27020.1 Inner membrane protein YccS [Variovorax sp. SRS16]
MGFPAIETFRRWLSAFARRGQPLRVLIALGSAAALCGFGGHLEAAPPVLLGIAASALAETDDSWRGRLRTQLFAWICLAIAASVAALLFDKPLIFAAVLVAAAFCLTMLGAVDVRYKPIGHATLILALSVVLAVGQAPATGIERGHLLRLLLAGAAGYGLLSVLWCAVLPAQPVQLRLVRLFDALGDGMRFRASLSGAARGPDFEREGLSLALFNAAVVTGLNAAKESILRRIGTGAPTECIARYRGLYLIAQDVHERASAFHHDTGPPDEGSLHDALLVRCRQVLDLLGQGCIRLARSIERHEPLATEAGGERALADLHTAIAHARDSAAMPDRMASLPSIEAIAQNLAQLEERLASASQPSGRTVRTDLGPLDRAPRSWRDAARRVRRQLATRSALFRHALRLTLALLVGGGAAWLLRPSQGGWILLAALLVCQQSAGETVARIGRRMAGTLVGIAAGWGLQQVLAQPLPHALLAVAAGVFFFAARDERSLRATAAMALLVMLCSSPAKLGVASIAPLLADAAAGCVIAALALLLVLPYWQARRINELAAASLRNHAAYLRQAIEQYRAGAHDDLAYRLARRNAHNADAALSTAVADLLRDPRWMWPRALAALRFLLRSHALLSGLSALRRAPCRVARSEWVARLREAAEARRRRSSIGR